MLWSCRRVRYLIATCQAHPIDPLAHLRDVLQRIAAHTITQLAELLPDHRPAARTKAVAGSKTTTKFLQSEGPYTGWPDGNLQIVSRRWYSSARRANGPGTPGSAIGPRERAPNQNKYFSPNWIWRMAVDVDVTTPKF